MSLSRLLYGDPDAPYRDAVNTTKGDEWGKRDPKDLPLVAHFQIERAIEDLHYSGKSNWALARYSGIHHSTMRNLDNTREVKEGMIIGLKMAQKLLFATWNGHNYISISDYVPEDE